MTSPRPRLAFISPQFLFPNNTGGRIRTANILRGLKDGAFDVTLLLPASTAERHRWSAELATLCDRLIAWNPARERPRWFRAMDLLADLPVNVAADRRPQAIRAVHAALAGDPFDVVVFDFVHSAVLLPPRVAAATVCFTHNVEAEIFLRHATQATSVAPRWMWSTQYEKMRRFECEALQRFHTVVAVSERDAMHFRTRYGIAEPATIPTGVDLEFFTCNPPAAIDASHPPTVVFIGSMDWDANIDGVRHFLDDVWPLVQADVAEARFVVVGRKPPASLIEQARRLSGVTLTGFVDDVRPHVRAAHVAVIPLRIGGGTRIKAFEAMAMGCPVVSTSIGIEGLDVADGEHFLRRDSARDQAQAIVALLRDGAQRAALSQRARRCVEQRFGHRVAATVFEQACLRAIEKRRVHGAATDLRY